MLFPKNKWLVVFLAGVGVATGACCMQDVEKQIENCIPAAKYAIEWYNDGLDVNPKFDYEVLGQIKDAVKEHVFIEDSIVAQLSPVCEYFAQLPAPEGLCDAIDALIEAINKYDVKFSLMVAARSVREVLEKK